MSLVFHLLLWPLWLKGNDSSGQSNFIPNIPCLKWTNGLSDSSFVFLYSESWEEPSLRPFFVLLKLSHSSRLGWAHLPHETCTWSALIERLFSAIKLVVVCYPSAKLTVICPELSTVSSPCSGVQADFPQWGHWSLRTRPFLPAASTGFSSANICWFE